MSQAVMSRWTGRSGLAAVPSYVVMQPTTLCNLDCAYCYLPDRVHNRAMTPQIARAVAGPVNAWAAQHPGFSVVWHGGEPLAVGRAAFGQLLQPFSADVGHQVQTNATLINDAWCGLFRAHDVRVSLSLDGPVQRNVSRRNRAHRPAYDMVMHGVDALRRNDVDFSVLCVVSDPQPGQAAELYSYFLDLGCTGLGISIEEHEGINVRSNAHPDAAVRAFWAELTGAWRADPKLRVREIDWAMAYLRAALSGAVSDLLPGGIDPVPSVGYDGSVIMLSPELAGFTDPRYGDFSCGNVRERPLDAIVRDAAGTGWVAEYVAGVDHCRTACPYFGFCGGSNAGNRYFEHGNFAGGQTHHCRNSRIHLLDGVLDHATTTGPAATTSGPAATMTGPGGTTSGPGVTTSGPGVTTSGIATAGVGAAAGRAGHAAPRLAADPPAPDVRIHGLRDALGALSDTTPAGCDGPSQAYYDWNNRPR